MTPILARFRGLYEQATIPLGRICLRLGLTPNTLTLLSLVRGGLASYAVALGSFIGGVAMILVMGFAGELHGSTAAAGGTGTPYRDGPAPVGDCHAGFLIMVRVM